MIIIDCVFVICIWVLEMFLKLFLKWFSIIWWVIVGVGVGGGILGGRVGIGGVLFIFGVECNVLIILWYWVRWLFRLFCLLLIL